jgi:hypothetical protein
MSDSGFVDESNPYAVSPPESSNSAGSMGDGKLPKRDRRFYVEGELIRCGTSVRLPKICIRTGSTEDLVEVNKKLSHSPPILYLLLLLGLLGILIMVVLHLVLRKTCDTTYYMTRSARNGLRIRMAAGLAMFFVSLPLLFVFIFNNSGAILVIAMLVTMFGGLILAATSNALKIARHIDGREFWLSGCRQEFFASLRQIYESTGQIP